MSKRMLLSVWVLVGCGIVATGQAQQFIYKWNDEQGQIQYSELPPPSGVSYETVRKPAGFGKEGDQARDLAKEQEDLAKKLAEEEAKTQQQQQEQARKEEDVRAKNCEVAKKNVETLQSDRPVVKADAQGNKVALDAQQRATELQKAQKDLDYFCNP